MSKRNLKNIRQRCKECTLNSGEHELQVRSESANLCLIRNHVKMIGELCSLSEKQIFDLQVAIGEAAANAIEHGSPQGSENHVRIQVYCDGNALVIKVKDEGKFKRRMPDPGMDHNNFRGRGIPLMLALMDKVTIDEAKDGTSVVLTKRVKETYENKQAK
ncbi:MAG: hypothetical protein COW32_03585 [Candidatus Aquicultor secundus]|uniref:Histidine kinase/HSP90-like ATPase domain-containing protein n=1 Tax=Candidatus Aquicultor secundus TaxID=1973895 RepID=A0A2M7T837_9ACTN|nr:ATP-binding protein [Candidatus Aquicultor secundus]NCO66670.1 ATP-binding protein [Solirubrobacter sp.]OIO84347.1 MAG: hypothetical protein AUK32_08755 [Candidatus Aquicultor secundus]PIU26251.1 MAG: hypothetical protein COT10_09640 [Candidatus Aquicultor secundus]PIW22630.1 MAG: hypothetical protein COW32_03585 [Candidatus Aquicultor secundus]PIX52134.1 MAG: hypothetical protein COZ51_05870 [Candidatus Aquicultor secundus]